MHRIRTFEESEGKKESSCKLSDYTQHRETICLFRAMGIGFFLSNYGCNIALNFSCIISEYFLKIVIKTEVIWGVAVPGSNQRL